jgi:amino acid transporter
MIRLITYAATCAALPLLRRRAFGDDGGFRAPGGVLTVAAAIACCVWLVLPPTSNWRDVRLTVIAAVVGLVLYFVFRGKSGVRPEEAAARPAVGAR